MTQVIEINDWEELSQYRLLWNSLLPQTRRATFFQSFEWLETYWRHFGDRQRLRVLIVSADERPIGILPLTVMPEETRLGTVRLLTYPLDGWGTFYGPIGPNPTATLWTGLRHIARDAPRLGRRRLALDRRRRHRRRPDRQSHATAGMPAIETPFVQSAQIELDSDSNGSGIRKNSDAVANWQTYWVSRKSRWRQNMARAERRLAECGELTYIRYRPDGSRYGDDDPRWDLYNACESIARRSWQGAADDGTTLSHESVRDYLRDAHETAAAAGGLDLNLLLSTAARPPLPITITTAARFTACEWALTPP